MTGRVAVLVSVRVCVIAIIIVHCRVAIFVRISSIEIAIHVMTGYVAVAVATNINYWCPLKLSSPIWLFIFLGQPIY